MRILLADDHALFREGLSSLLQAYGKEVVGQVSNGLEAVQMASKLQPDLVLMDIFMPVMNGLEATRLIKADMPEIKIVILTVSEEEEDLFEAIKSGADGYLLKNLQVPEFFEMLDGVARNEAPLTRKMATRLLEEFAKTHGYESRSNLTQREEEVLRLVAQGLTNSQIAASLHISDNTVKYHLKKILAKLHLRNRLQVVAWATQYGYLRPEGKH